jgi:hypothetical protein
MKTGSVLLILYITMTFAGCALPVGDDYVIPRNENPGTTYITNYNLQMYVPIPNTGEQPVQGVTNREDVEVKVLWKDTGGTGVPLPFETFLGNTVYQAEMTITAKDGYEFYSTIPFTYPDGKVTFQRDDLKNSIRHITVTYNNSDDANVIFVTSYELQRFVPIPMAGDKPVISLTSRDDLTVGVEWKAKQADDFVPIPDDAAYTFNIGTVYQAAIRLKTKPGYRFVEVMNFEYTTETIITQYGSSTPEERNLAVTYAAAKSPKHIEDQDLTSYIPKPILGITPVKMFRGTQYTGTVLWKTAETEAVWDSPFQGGMAYKAEVNLTPATGYSFTGIGQDTFTHTEATAINNPANSGIVTISFPSIAFSSFGPVTADGSALKLMKENKDERSLTIKLPPRTEGVRPNTVTLVAGTNSPAQVVIDGTGGVLILMPYELKGKILTVGNGVTLTLQNITLWGHENNTPLVEIKSGGTLIMGAGAVLGENKNNGDTGGVWINGGKLIMNAGAIIENMAGEQCGGVLISTGEFIMNDGSIHNNTVDLSRKTVGNIAGGVLNTGGTFIMDNGIIEKNYAKNPYTTTGNIGGGVFNEEKGVFVMNNGSIKGNTAKSGDSSYGHAGGGVFNINGTFTMNNGVIQDNTAKSGDSSYGHAGGGVFNINSTFSLNNGVIQGNEVTGSNNYGNGGGGVFNGQLGVFNMKGGTIGGKTKGANQASGGTQTANGVYNDNIFTMSGGIITGNTVGPNDEFNTGVFNGGTFIMTASAKVAPNNRVDLFTDKYITINSNLTASPPVANIKYLDAIPSDNTTQTLLSANTPYLLTENYSRFYYDGKYSHISPEGKYLHP